MRVHSVNGAHSLQQSLQHFTVPRSLSQIVFLAADRPQHHPTLCFVNWKVQRGKWKHNTNTAVLSRGSEKRRWNESFHQTKHLVHKHPWLSNILVSKNAGAQSWALSAATQRFKCVCVWDSEKYFQVEILVSIAKIPHPSIDSIRDTVCLLIYYWTVPIPSGIFGHSVIRMEWLEHTNEEKGCYPFGRTLHPGSCRYQLPVDKVLSEIRNTLNTLSWFIIEEILSSKATLLCNATSDKDLNRYRSCYYVLLH